MDARKTEGAGVPHWKRPQRVGDQFTELAREGIASLYEVLNALVEEQYLHGSTMRLPTAAPNLGRWGDMHRELATLKRAWATSINSVDRPPYGESYARARSELVNTPMVRHVLTEEEATASGYKELKAGAVEFRPDPSQSKTATATEVGERWTEVFTEEVEQLMKDEPGSEHEAGLNELVRRVKDHGFGLYEGAAAIKRLKSEGPGGEAWKAFERIRRTVNDRLDEIADEYAPVPDMAHTGPQIRWKGNIMELAELVHILETEGWIEGGQTRSKLAERIAAMFEASEGQPFNLPTLKTYLGKRYIRTPREGVVFTISKNPNKT